MDPTRFNHRLQTCPIPPLYFSASLGDSSYSTPEYSAAGDRAGPKSSSLSFTATEKKILNHSKLVGNSNGTYRGKLALNLSYISIIHNLLDGYFWDTEFEFHQTRFRQSESFEIARNRLIVLMAHIEKTKLWFWFTLWYFKCW